MVAEKSISRSGKYFLTEGGKFQRGSNTGNKFSSRLAPKKYFPRFQRVFPDSRRLISSKLKFQEFRGPSLGSLSDSGKSLGRHILSSLGSKCLIICWMENIMLMNSKS